MKGNLISLQKELVRLQFFLFVLHNDGDGGYVL